MKYPIILFFFMMGGVSPVFAILAKSDYILFKQPDGTSLSIILKGDEHFHCMYTLDGLPVVFNEDGYYYARLSGQNLVHSTRLAHNMIDRNGSELDYVMKNGNKIREMVSNIWDSKLKLSNLNRSLRCTRSFQQLFGDNSRYVGEKKGLVILVDFTNKKMQETSPEEINKMFNEYGYNHNGHIGSVHDYFYDQSYGKLNLEFDVVGPVLLSETYGYYGSNVSLNDNDRYPGEMVIEACRLVDKIVDFSDYDWDNNGEVDQVFIVYAGYGESFGAPRSTIWPHESSLSNRKMLNDGDGPVCYDGVMIDTYACSCELYGSSGVELNGIGTACHEFSHCMGLPDLYDTYYSGAFGMNSWDIMAAGSHNGPSGKGEVPYGYSAYERWFAGWMELEEIEETRKVKDVQNLADVPIAYTIVNDNEPNEFYILENHQADGWFKYVNRYKAGHGLMVTHVDYDPIVWNRNLVNSNKNHQRLSIIPADNYFGTYNEEEKSYSITEEDLLGDLFPGLKNISALTNSSHKETGGTLFNRNTDGSHNMNKSILNIKEIDGLVSFDVICADDIIAPVATEPVIISDSSFEATWKSVDNAESYILELTTYLSLMPKKTSLETFTDIMGTSYRFVDLQYKNYTYRVKTVSQSIESEWSDYIHVSLKEATGVDEFILNDNNTIIYNIKGQKQICPSLPGIYIYKKNGKCYKKIVY